MQSQNRRVPIVAVAAALAAAPSSRGQSGSGGDVVSVTSAEMLNMEMGPNVGWQPEAPDPEEKKPTVPGEAEPSRFHLSFGTDFTTAYLSRGFMYEDSGFIAQPYADLTVDLFRMESATISLKAGTWNSFQGQATDAGTDDSFKKYWYECDLYAGVGIEAGKLAIEARYYFYTSPSDAFDTIEELYFSAAFDDSEYLGAWSLKPTVILATETGSNANDDARRGTYLQLGISPGFTVEEGWAKDIEVSFPVSVGLSLSNYYESENGENDAFGYVSFGAKAEVPLNFDASWGEWTLSASVQGVYLGDAASTFNDGNDFEVVATVGISIEF